MPSVPDFARGRVRVGRRHLELALSLIAACLLVSGCSRPVAERFGASGTVTLDGEPLPNANIVFVPRHDQDHSHTARIVDGKFAVPDIAGLEAGEYDVLIVPARPEFEEVDAAFRSGATSPLEAVPIPPPYQQPGMLQATVGADQPRDQYQFDVKTR